MLVKEIIHPLDLTGMIREILEETELSDPVDITRELITRIPPEALRDVLETVMPAYVRNRIGAERALTTPAAAERLLVRSAKVGGISEWWRRVLDDRVSVPTTGYKRLADCTETDLKLLAEALHERADALAAKAQRYDRLREHLSELHRPGAKVSDLSVPVLKAWVGTLPNGADGVSDED